MPYNANDYQIKLKDGRVTVITFGTGEKPLVMIPGLRFSTIDGNAQQVSWAYRIFAKDYRVYVIDRKFPPMEGCTIHDLAEDTAVIIEKLGINKACIFGVSQGGMIAQELAIDHAGLVKKLALGVSASRNNDTLEEVISHWTDMASRGGYDEIATDYINKGFSEAYLRKYRRFLPLLIKTLKTMPIEHFVTLAKACLTVDTYDRLDQIKCPVLILGGARDRILSGEASVEMAKKLGCEYYIYEELSHEAYNEAKDFNRRIYDFFDQTKQ